MRHGGTGMFHSVSSPCPRSTNRPVRSWLSLVLSDINNEETWGYDMHCKTRKSDCMRVWTRLLTGFIQVTLALSVIAHVGATTLEQLTLDDMARKSTEIVRARVTGSHTGMRGTSIFTFFQLQILENWKGQTVTEVAIPGGVADGVRQAVSGAPELKTGQEYVLFLWTSRSGLTQVIGLSQGVFRLSEEGSGGGSRASVAQRPAASELMLDRSGRPVEDHAVSMPLRDLQARVRQALVPVKSGAAE